MPTNKVKSQKLKVKSTTQKSQLKADQPLAEKVVKVKKMTLVEKDSKAESKTQELKHFEDNKGKKKTLVGQVISDKMQKTVVVMIVRKVQHPIYKKIIKKTKKLKADTNNMDVKVGDTVKIEETRPLSKDKFFKVIEKI